MTVYENLAFGLRVRKPQSLGRRARPRGQVGCRDGRALGGARPSRRAPVRQRPAEGRARAVDDRQAGDLPPRRAVLEPRRGVPRVHARGAQADPARDRPDDGLRHARPGGGDGHGGQDRRHAPRRAPAVRHARRALQQAGEPLRRELHRVGSEQLPARAPRAAKREHRRRRRRRRREPRSTSSDRRAAIEARPDTGGGLTLSIRPERDPARRPRLRRGDDSGHGRPRRAARSEGHHPPLPRGAGSPRRRRRREAGRGSATTSGWPSTCRPCISSTTRPVWR